MTRHGSTHGSTHGTQQRTMRHPARPRRTTGSLWTNPTSAMRARAEQVAPLFTYLHASGISEAWLGRTVGPRVTAQRRQLHRTSINAIAHGVTCPPPDLVTFVLECCDVLRRTPTQIMGAAWVQAHLDTFRRTCDRLSASASEDDRPKADARDRSAEIAS